MGDLFLAGNGNATFSCINVSGNAVFLSGQTAAQYQITTSGSVPLSALSAPLFGSSACSNALRSIITAPRTHSFEADYTNITGRSIAANGTLSAALSSGAVLTTPFPAGNSLGDQLKMVARVIASAGTLGAKRQVFFVSLGGFDTHSALSTTHPALLAKVGAALSAFYNATLELGIASQITTFTASDFGRTLTVNNGGSDHGWGGMHFVLGGAVNGRRYYGTPPIVANNGADDVGQGRLLPTTSVDQYAATLGRWFGVSESDLLMVLPNLANFSAGTRNLGFV